MIQKVKNIVPLIVGSVLLFSCEDKKEIKKTVQSVYEVAPQLSDTNDLSEELLDLLKEVGNTPTQAVNNKSRTKKKGETEPNLLLGNTKRFTSFKIETIGIRHNKATAAILLINDEDKEEWIDTVKLIYQKKWKIDDIVYDKISKPAVPTLKETLQRKDSSQKSKREIYS